MHHWKVYASGPQTTGDSRNPREKLFLIWRVFLPLQGVLTEVWSEAFTALCLSWHTAHCPPWHREGWTAGFAAHVSKWAVSLWDLQNLQCFETLLLSFLLSLSILFFFFFFFCFLILTMHSNTQRDHQVTRAGAGLAVSLRACRLVHAHAWQDDHVSGMTLTVDNNSSGIYERKCGN